MISISFEGESWELELTTTAMPEALRIGFAMSRGRIYFLKCSGIAAMIAVKGGILLSLCFLDILERRLLRFKSFFGLVGSC